MDSARFYPQSEFEAFGSYRLSSHGFMVWFVAWFASRRGMSRLDVPMYAPHCTNPLINTLRALSPHQASSSFHSFPFFPWVIHILRTFKRCLFSVSCAAVSFSLRSVVCLLKHIQLQYLPQIDVATCLKSVITLVLFRPVCRSVCGSTVTRLSVISLSLSCFFALSPEWDRRV